MAMKNEVNVPLIATIGGVSVVLLVVIIIGVQAWFTSEERDERAAQWDASPNVAVVVLAAFVPLGTIGVGSGPSTCCHV